MSDSDRYGESAPYIVLVIGLFLVGYATWQLASSRAYHAAYEYHERSHYQYEIAERQQRECGARATFEEAFNCLEEAIAASRDNHRAEQDLSAQQQMADWAYWMTIVTFGVGIGTIGVASLGVYWVKETLIVTRNAVKAAEDTVEVTDRFGKAQLRAYVFPVAAKLVGTGKATPNVNIQFKNTGATPAHRCSITWHVAAIHASDGFEIPINTLPRIQPSIGPGQPVTVSKIIQPIGWQKIVALLQNPMLELHAFGTLRYFDAFGFPHITSFRMKRLVSEGKTIEDGDFVFCDGGNDSD